MAHSQDNNHNRPPRPPQRRRSRGRGAARANNNNSNKPVRPMNGYNLFYREYNQKLSDTRRDGAPPGGLQGLTNAVAKAWWALDPVERARYESMGRALQEQYRVDLYAYMVEQQEQQQQQQRDNNAARGGGVIETGTMDEYQIREHILQLKRAGKIQDAVCLKRPRPQPMLPSPPVDATTTTTTTTTNSSSHPPKRQCLLHAEGEPAAAGILGHHHQPQPLYPFPSPEPAGSSPDNWRHADDHNLFVGDRESFTNVLLQHHDEEESTETTSTGPSSSSNSSDPYSSGPEVAHDDDDDDNEDEEEDDGHYTDSTGHRRTLLDEIQPLPQDRHHVQMSDRAVVAAVAATNHSIDGKEHCTATAATAAAAAAAANNEDDGNSA